MVDQAAQDKTEKPDLTFNCTVSVNGVANSEQSKSFCAALSSELKRNIQLEIANLVKSTTARYGLLVQINRIGKSRAVVDLDAGEYRNKTFTSKKKQRLELDVTDAPLGPQATRALIYPIITMLRELLPGKGK